MIISHPLKFIFIHVHRTGGTTISNFLRSHLNGNFISNSQHGNAKTSESKFLKAYNDYFTDGKGKLKVDKIFRYEHYDLALEELMDKFNLPLLEVPLLNHTDTGEYRKYYTRKSQKLIAEKCKLDIEYFNYSFYT